MYNWENSGKPQRKKVKKTGTVVLHSDEAVDTAFERLLKEVPVERTREREAEAAPVKSALMTQETAKRLQSAMGFEQLLPCQAQCYRGIFNGRDAILHSRTGSGKTLAYALPLIERHLLLEAAKKEDREGPFLLIFVFSNDLAVQTKGVLEKVYPSLKVAVGGMDALNGKLDVLIGTVRHIDEAIRGRKVAAAATAAEEKEKAAKDQLFGKQPHSSKRRRAEEEEDGDDEEDADLNEDDDEDEVDGNDHTASHGEVSAADVRAVVVDEVDTTLGPRFSNVGRRMKNLLKFVRHHNGSLTDGLLNDFRAHHYVLCGATVPNWVIKAGFLGVKKFYYQLITVGTEKLPAQLECHKLFCPAAKRVEMAVSLLRSERAFLGRTIVFGHPKQVKELEAALAAAAPAKQAKGGASASSVVARTLTLQEEEADRIQSIEDFNAKRCNVLLCTDYAARGLDFVEVDSVLMFSLPKSNMAAETFVHRAGRTARVGRAGRCLVLFGNGDAEPLDAITKATHTEFRIFSPSTGANSASNNKGHGTSTPAAAATVRYELTVRNPFKMTRPTAVPPAKEVLQTQVGDELRKKIQSVEEKDGGEKVVFTVPAAIAHEVKKRLWKYSLKEVATVAARK